MPKAEVHRPEPTVDLTGLTLDEARALRFLAGKFALGSILGKVYIALETALDEVDYDDIGWRLMAHPSGDDNDSLAIQVYRLRIKGGPT